MILVDGIRVCAPKTGWAKRHGRLWCHMWCDGDLEELHGFAKMLGIKKIHFQHHDVLPHYDIIPSMKRRALMNGAVETSLSKWLRERG